MFNIVSAMGERAQPFFTPISNGQIHFGEVGSGTAYTLMVNWVGNVQMAATVEGKQQ
jgi:3-hydroxyisobutyrate dehydrogenase